MALTIRPISCAALAMLCASAVATPARAWDPWSTLPPAATATAPEEAPAADSGVPTASPDVPEPDWSLLDSSSPSSIAANLRAQGKKPAAEASAWTGQNRADGSSALSVKQPLTSFWDTRVGADINVARQSSPSSTSDMFREKFGAEGAQSPSQSGGTAWAAATAPGVGAIWDKTAIEARIDPGQDQSKLGTTLSKSVPLSGNQYSLTLQNGYNVIQQAGLPAIGFNGRPVRSYETDQSATLSISDSGTSIVAGQTLSTTDDKWLRKVGAEQKLFGGVNIAASVSETLQGPANKSLTAGFKHSW